MPDLEREIFDQASATETPAEPATELTPAASQPEAAAPAANQDRDEHGRFKPKGDQPAATPAVSPAASVAEPEPQGDHRIPLTELLNEREKRQAFEREAAEERRQREALSRQLEELRRPKPQAAPRPDPWQDPGAFAEHVAREQVSPLQQQHDAMIDRFSRLMAVQSYGKPLVDEAYAALESAVRENPAARFEAQRIWQNEHPYGALVDWHKSQKALKEIGNDPAAYETRLREKLMADPEFRKAIAAKIQAEATTPAPGTRPTNVTRLPPSLNRLPSAAPNNAAGGEEAISDQELFRFASKG